MIDLSIVPNNVKRNITYLAIGLAVVSVAVFAYKLLSPKPAAVTTYATAPPAKGMANAPTTDVELKVPLVVYDKAVVAKKLKFPPLPSTQEVLTTSTLKPSEGGYTTATVIDTETGVAETIVREEGRSLFGFGGQSEIGIRGGLSTGGPEGAVYIRQDLLRVGGVYVAGYGELTGRGAIPEAKAMLDISYRW